MDNLPGKPVKATRTMEIFMSDENEDFEVEVPATFQSLTRGPDGLFRVLDVSNGDLFLINPDFLVGVCVSGDIETDMDD